MIFCIFSMAEEQWRRYILSFDLTVLQWEKWDQEKKNVLSHAEIVELEAAFAEMKFFIASHDHQHQDCCLRGFHERYINLTNRLTVAALKMGINVRLINSESLDYS